MVLAVSNGTRGIGIDAMILAWDFDGVLNQNQRDGRYVWEDAFEREVGQTAGAFATFVFGTAPYVISGEIDILERLQHWTEVADCRMAAKAILEFCLAQDARPDAEMLALIDDLNRAGQRQFIATNNEVRRAAYICRADGHGQSDGTDLCIRRDGRR